MNEFKFNQINYFKTLKHIKHQPSNNIEFKLVSLYYSYIVNHIDFDNSLTDDTNPEYVADDALFSTHEYDNKHHNCTSFDKAYDQIDK